MKNREENRIIKWFKNHPICILTLFITFLQLFFVWLLILSQHSILPIHEKDLPILLSVWGSLMASAVGAGAILYISGIQQKIQYEFFLEQETNERKRLLLQFYIHQLDRFVEKHQEWITISDFFIKNIGVLSLSEIKWHCREIWDGLVLLYRFHNIFPSVEEEEYWKQLEQQILFLEAWFKEKASALKEGKIASELATEYHAIFYVPISRILNDISDTLMKSQKQRITALEK